MIGLPPGGTSLASGGNAMLNVLLRTILIFFVLAASMRLLGKRVDALNGPDRLAAKAARTYDEKVSHFDLSP